MNEVTPYERERDERLVFSIDTIRELTDDQVRALILNAQDELRLRLEMRQRDVRERQEEEMKALTLERQQLALLGVVKAETNGHKKGRRKGK